ncbi:MAG: hypothetical protein JO051_14120, partial [Acidobacteriaceae bacterium]|nr:hypothetical protein [Acidobacteriaceae bacterium]
PPAFQAPKPQPVVSPSGDIRQDFYQALSKAGLEHSADAIQHSEVKLNGQKLLIRIPKAMMLLLKDPAVERVAAQVAGKPVRVRLEACENISAAPVAASNEKAASPERELRERALSHPSVKRFQELFPDAQVRTVRNLNE